MFVRDTDNTASATYLTLRLQFHQAVPVAADRDPLELPRRDLLVVDDVVADGTVALVVEREFVASQTWVEIMK